MTNRPSSKSNHFTHRINKKAASAGKVLDEGSNPKNLENDKLKL